MKAESRVGISSRVAALVALIVIAGSLFAYTLESHGPGISYSSTAVTTSTTELTGSSTATTSTSSSSVSSPEFPPLLNVSMVHEICTPATSPPGTFSGCALAPTLTLGVPQTFNMTEPTHATTQTTMSVDHLFGVQLNQSELGSLQFSYGSASFVAFTAYFDGCVSCGPETLAQHLANDQPTVLLNYTTKDEIQFFSGQIDAKQEGLYIFVFSTSSGNVSPNPETFLLRDPSLYGDGISISIGTRTDFSGNTTYGSMQNGFEELSVVVRSDVTTDVNMSASYVPLGDWAKFVPSYLPDVGPNGANTTLLLAGALKTFIPSEYNMSIYMDAIGSDGTMGYTIMPVIPNWPVEVLNSPGPVKSVPEINYANTQLTTGETSQITYGLVYDPESPSAAPSLAVSLTVSGFIPTDGKTEAVPSWLDVRQPQPTFTLPAYEDYYFAFDISLSSKAPIVQGSLVLTETVNGQQFTGALTVFITPPAHG